MLFQRWQLMLTFWKSRTGWIWSVRLHLLLYTFHVGRGILCSFTSPGLVAPSLSPDPLGLYCWGFPGHREPSGKSGQTRDGQGSHQSVCQLCLLALTFSESLVLHL